MEKEGKRINTGVKPGKENVLGCSVECSDPCRDKCYLPQQVVFIKLIKIQLQLIVMSQLNDKMF